MSLQLIEVYVPKNMSPSLLKEVEEFEMISHWTTKDSPEFNLVRILVEKKNSEDILNYLENASSHNKQLKALLFSLKTYIPYIEEKQEKRQTKKETEEEKELIRASRQELYSVVYSSSEINKSFSWFLLLSALVATAGIIKNSAAIVIGAMMIAPLIGPFSAIAFASVLGDYKLLRQSSLSSLYGLAIPIGIAALFGFLFPIPVNSQEFLSRMNIELIDIVAALASGAAGAISFLKRVAEAFVGVMVSVALLPPAVVFGMTVGAANWQESITPLLLLFVNISSIVLSAIIVFWMSGIKPVNWEEIQDAHTSRTFSLIFVGIIIVVLIFVVLFINF